MENLDLIKNMIRDLEHRFGKGAIMILGEASNDMTIETSPTGSISLDFALGLGGIPKGRVIEIFGGESSGKTTLSLHMISEVQKKGGIAAFIDAEHAFDANYAKNIGINTSELYVSQPNNGNEALEILEKLVESSAIDIVVIDSVAALVPRQELEGDMGDSHMALHARLMSQALRKLTPSISKSNCIVVFINQLREKIGMLFGNPEITTGGKALKFYSSVRLEVRRGESIRRGEDIIGNTTLVRVVKNKIAPPFKKAEFDIVYGKGISKAGELLDLATRENIIMKSGSWYIYKDERIGQGRDKAMQYLISNNGIQKDIEEKLKAM